MTSQEDSGSDGGRNAELGTEDVSGQVRLRCKHEARRRKTHFAHSNAAPAGAMKVVASRELGSELNLRHTKTTRELEEGTGQIGQELPSSPPTSPVISSPSARTSIFSRPVTSSPFGSVTSSPGANSAEPTLPTQGTGGPTKRKLKSGDQDPKSSLHRPKRATQDYTSTAVSSSPDPLHGLGPDPRLTHFANVGPLDSDEEGDSSFARDLSRETSDPQT